MERFTVVAINTDMRDGSSWSAGVIGPFFSYEEANRYRLNKLGEHVVINPNEFVTTESFVEEIYDPYTW